MVAPVHDDEDPSKGFLLGVRGALEPSLDGSDQDEAEAVDEVADDERPAASDFIDEEHCAELSEYREYIADGLIFQRACRIDSDTGIYLWREVLDC